MGLSTIVSKDKDKGKLLVGSGVALEATILDPTIKTGTDQEIVHLLNHVSPPEITMLWILLLSSARLQMTKNVRNTKRWADALNVGSKVTLFAIVPTKRHVLELLALFKSKMTTSWSSPKLPPHPYLSLRK